MFNLKLIYILQGNILDQDYIVLDFLYIQPFIKWLLFLMQIMMKQNQTETLETARERESENK